jgi:hypothetical protein
MVMPGAVDDIPVCRIAWKTAFRFIRSIHLSIDLFDDISDPRDWEALASAEAKSNPLVHDQIGNMYLVPPDRRVGDPGAYLLMSPFVHCSPDRPGRFSDGRYGTYYAADTEETALYEVAHHHGTFMKSTRQAPGWTSQFRSLVGSVDASLHDVSKVPGILDPVDYEPGQRTGSLLRESGSHGVYYPSARAPGGDCIGIFWPDVLPIPMQGDHFEFHWNGVRVDRVRNLTTTGIFAL